MAIRLEALPTDSAALSEMVLALDAENEKVRVAMQTLKDMIFGKRSEGGPPYVPAAKSGVRTVPQLETRSSRGPAVCCHRRRRFRIKNSSL
jgi:hypothetical protein